MVTWSREGQRKEEGPVPERKGNMGTKPQGGPMRRLEQSVGGI